MNINIGDTYSVKKIITDKDIKLFAEASGDFNPIHIDDDYAKKTIFGQRIAHGMLSASYISAILGTNLPGEGSIYISQSLKFLKPVLIGDELTTIVKAVSISNNICTLETTCINQRGKKVVDGIAEILLPSGDSNV